MLSENVAKFKATIEKINVKLNDLIAGEKEAFITLKDFWQYNAFNPTYCEELLRKVALGKNKHPNDKKLLEALQDFRRLCKDYYTKEQAIYETFQKALGGKRNKKPQPVPQPVPKPQPQPQPQKSKPVFGNDRIDYPNGDYYIGKYNNEQPNGKGKYYYQNGDWKEGFFISGELHGQGSKYFTEYKRTDHGQYKHGNRIGKGIMLWKDGDRYEGEWNADGINGKGKYSFTNGSWREGYFNNGQLHGKGKYYNSEYKYTESGNYQHGELVGKAVTEWNNGHKFKGIMIDSNNGEGTYYYEDGKKERGMFVNGKWIPSVGKRSHSVGSWLSNIGTWIWEHITYIPWVIATIATIMALFTNGFWMAVMTGIFGAIGAVISSWLIIIVKAILEIIYEILIALPKMVKIILCIAVIVTVVYFSGLKKYTMTFYHSNEPLIELTQEKKIEGKWSGKIGSTEAQLEILSIDKGNVNAEIHFSNNRVEKLSGVINDSILFLKDQIINGLYDGEYIGTITDNEKTFSGSYFNQLNNKRANFKFLKQ